MLQNRLRPLDLFYGQPARHFLSGGNDKSTDSCLGSSQGISQNSAKELSQTIESPDLFTELHNSAELQKNDSLNSAYEKYMSLKPCCKMTAPYSKSQDNCLSVALNSSSSNPTAYAEVKDQLQSLHEVLKQVSNNVVILKEDLERMKAKHEDRQSVSENPCGKAMEQLSEDIKAILAVAEGINVKMKESHIASVSDFSTLKEDFIKSCDGIAAEFRKTCDELKESIDKGIKQNLSDGIAELVSNASELLAKHTSNSFEQLASNKQDQDKMMHIIQEFHKEHESKHSSFSDTVMRLSQNMQKQLEEGLLELKTDLRNFLMSPKSASFCASNLVGNQIGNSPSNTYISQNKMFSPVRCQRALTFTNKNYIYPGSSMESQSPFMRMQCISENNLAKGNANMQESSWYPSGGKESTNTQQVGKEHMPQCAFNPDNFVIRRKTAVLPHALQKLPYGSYKETSAVRNSVLSPLQEATTSRSFLNISTPANMGQHSHYSNNQVFNTTENAIVPSVSSHLSYVGYNLAHVPEKENSFCSPLRMDAMHMRRKNQNNIAQTMNTSSSKCQFNDSLVGYCREDSMNECSRKNVGQHPSLTKMQQRYNHMNLLQHESLSDVNFDVGSTKSINHAPSHSSLLAMKESYVSHNCPGKHFPGSLNAALENNKSRSNTPLHLSALTNNSAFNTGTAKVADKIWHHSFSPAKAKNEPYYDVDSRQRKIVLQAKPIQNSNPLKLSFSPSEVKHDFEMKKPYLLREHKAHKYFSEDNQSVQSKIVCKSRKQKKTKVNTSDMRKVKKRKVSQRKNIPAYVPSEDSSVIMLN